MSSWVADGFMTNTNNSVQCPTIVSYRCEMGIMEIFPGQEETTLWISVVSCRIVSFCRWGLVSLSGAEVDASEIEMSSPCHRQQCSLELPEMPAICQGLLSPQSQLTKLTFSLLMVVSLWQLNPCLLLRWKMTVIITSNDQNMRQRRKKGSRWSYLNSKLDKLITHQFV